MAWEMVGSFGNGAPGGVSTAVELLTFPAGAKDFPLDFAFLPMVARVRQSNWALTILKDKNHTLENCEHGTINDHSASLIIIKGMYFLRRKFMQRVASFEGCGHTRFSSFDKPIASALGSLCILSGSVL